MCMDLICGMNTLHQQPQDSARLQLFESEVSKAKRTSLGTFDHKQAMVQQVLQPTRPQEGFELLQPKKKLNQANLSETSGDVLNNLNMMKFMTVTNVCPSGSNL